MTNDAIGWPDDGSESGPDGSPLGGEHDETPDEGGELDTTPTRRTTPLAGGPDMGDDDGSDEEPGNLLHMFSRQRDEDGAPATVLVPCWAFIGESFETLDKLESLGPEPSLRACGNHYMEIPRYL